MLVATPPGFVWQPADFCVPSNVWVSFVRVTWTAVTRAFADDARIEHNKKRTRKKEKRFRRLLSIEPLSPSPPRREGGRGGKDRFAPRDRNRRNSPSLGVSGELPMSYLTSGSERDAPLRRASGP